MAAGETETASGGNEGGDRERSTHFVFAHPVFRTPDARFTLAADASPCMVIKLADLDATVTLKSLRSEFNLDNKPDGAMLDKVVAGLKFVHVIRPGDSIPREILDGTASWSVEERHLEIARGRITVQISSWLSGQETVISDQDALMQLANDPAVKARVNEAFGEIAKKIGLTADRRQDVIDRVDQVVRELAYIEALRERFQVIRSLQGKISAFHRLYRRERTLAEEILRIENLFRRPMAEIGDIFDQVDAQSGEIISLLRNLTSQIAFIRESRDELHTRLMLWDDLVVKWAGITPERSQENEAALKEFYRFLARNFIMEKPWQLAGGATVRPGGRG